MLVEGVLRALAGEPRAEGATRIDPAALGRVLGLDRGPEVKTIRRKITDLAATGRANELLAAMAAAHVARLDKSNPDLLAVFYVDGHVRAYQGARKVAKTHLSRLKFPAPATVETWVSDAAGDPVLVVMADPGASLAMELRRLLPDLRRAVGDHRRVLVGFDRGGWSPALFAHMDAEGFDVLTWRKGYAEDVDPTLFTDLTYTDETGRTHQWRVADTTVDLPEAGNDEVFTMRQVSMLVANRRSSGWSTPRRPAKRSSPAAPVAVRWCQRGSGVATAAAGKGSSRSGRGWSMPWQGSFAGGVSSARQPHRSQIPLADDTPISDDEPHGSPTGIDQDLPATAPV
jgi:hypothetical protein